MPFSENNTTFKRSTYHYEAGAKLSDREDSNITWMTCPDCGAKLGVVISVGKSGIEIQAPSAPKAVSAPHLIAQEGIPERLVQAGVDLNLVDVEDGEETFSVRPKKFLGDLWGPINEAVRTLDGIWIRDGRHSRWEIKKRELK